MKSIIANEIRQSIKIKELLLQSEHIEKVLMIAETIISAYKNEKKILLCGNGGSASDALHIEGELVGRFKTERKGLPAIALGTGIASLTAIANDYGYDDVYRRQVEAYGKYGDVLLVFSTSGNSENIVAAVKEAKNNGMTVIGLLGKDGGILKTLVDIPLIVPSDDTARVQECHIMIGHIICGLVESGFQNLNT